MKKFRVFLLVMLVFFLGTISAFSVPDSCLTLLYPDGYNPDLILIDTCKNSPTFGERYQEGTWVIHLSRYIFKEIIKKADIAYLEDIDSFNFPEEYAGYADLEKRFGKISFKRDPWINFNQTDAGFIKYPTLDVWFSKYSNTNEVIWRLSITLGVGTIYIKYPARPSDIIEQNQNECIQLTENKEILKIKLNCDSLILSNDLSVFNILGEHFDKLSDQLNSNSSIGNEINIDISYLPTGIYFLKIGDKILKFIKY